MRLKATFEDPRQLLVILQVCRSIQRDCIIRLHPSRTRFFTNIGGVDGVQVWVGCRTEALFTDFRCHSEYRDGSITCEVLDAQQLIHVIRQADLRQGGTKDSRPLMRLARGAHGRPIFKLSMQSCQGLPDLSYDVPVRILSESEIENMQAPPLEDDRVQVSIPSMSELTTFVDKLKSSSCESVTFSARGHCTPALGGSNRKRTRGSGSVLATGNLSLATLTIYAEHFLGSFSLEYNAVELIDQVPKDGEEDEEEEEESRPNEQLAATVTVEVRTFARFFSAVKEFNPTRVSMYLVDERALVLSVHAGATTMVAYIPAKRN